MLYSFNGSTDRKDIVISLKTNIRVSLVSIENSRNYTRSSFDPILRPPFCIHSMTGISNIADILQPKHIPNCFTYLISQVRRKKTGKRFIFATSLPCLLLSRFNIIFTQKTFQQFTHKRCSEKRCRQFEKSFIANYKIVQKEIVDVYCVPKLSGVSIKLMID